MAKLTLEDIAKTRKKMAEVNQIKNEEIAKQTNAAPIYGNKIPTLEQHYQNQVAQNAQIDTRNVDRAQEAAIKKAARDLQQIQDARRAQERADEYNNHIATVRSRRGNNEILPSERALRPSTKYSNEIAGQTNTGRKRTPYDTEFNDFYEWRFNRADTTDYDPQTDTNIPHWEQVKEDMKKKHNWSEEQFNKYWEQYNASRNQQMAEEEVEKGVELAQQNRLLGNLAKASYAPQQALEGGATVLNALAGLVNRNNLPTSANDTQFTGTRAADAINQAIRDKSNTWLGKGAHDFVNSLEDMGLNYALGGGSSLGMGVVSGLRSAARNNMTALERGADPLKAAMFGTMGGAVSGVMNTIGLDGVLGAEAKTALRALAKAGVREGAENISEDMLTLAWDQIINQNASQLQTLHDYYVANGDDDKTAWKKVIGDTARDLGISALSGAAFGGLISAGKNLPSLTKEIGDAAYKLPFVDVNNKHYTSEIENLVANNTDDSARLPEIKTNPDQKIDWGREGKQPQKEIPAVKQAPKAEEQELPWNEPAQPGTIENYRNNRAQLLEAAQAQAQQGNAWEYQRIVDTVNRMDAETQQLHPDWFDETGAVKQAEAKPEGIQVYRGYNRSDNPLESNLARQKTLSDVLGGKRIPGTVDPEMLPLEYYTENMEDAESYANHDKLLYDSLRENATAKMMYEILEHNRKFPTEAEKEAFIKEQMDESYRRLTGREPEFGGGHVDTHTINPKNILDLTELGDTTNVDNVYKLLAEKTGLPETAFEGKNIDDYLRLGGMDDRDDFNTYELLRNLGVENADYGSRFVNLMRDYGYDAVKYTEDGYNHYAVLNDSNNAKGETPAEVNPDDVSRKTSTPKSQIPTVAEPQSAILDNDLEAKRAELVNRLNTKGLKIDEMADIQRQINAIDDELSQTNPDLFQDGKYVGQNKAARYDTTEDMDETDGGEAIPNTYPKTYEEAVAKQEALEKKYSNMRRYSDEPVTVTKSKVPDDIIEHYSANSLGTDHDPYSTERLTLELAKRGYNVMENGGNNNILNDLFSTMNDAVAHHLAVDLIPAADMAEAYDMVYQQGGTLNDALHIAAEMAGTKLSEGDENVGSAYVISEGKAEAPKTEAPKAEAPAKATPEEKAATRQRVSDTYQRMKSKIDDKSLRDIKFDNPDDKAAFDSARKDFYSSVHKLSEVMETAKDINEMQSAIDDVDNAYKTADEAVKKGHILDNSWKNSVKEVKQKFAENTRGQVIKLPDAEKEGTSLKDMTLREINSRMSTLGGNNYLKFSKNGGSTIDSIWDELVTASGNELKTVGDSNEEKIDALYEYMNKLRDAESDKITMDEGLQMGDFWDELFAAANEAGNKLQMNLQTFAKAKDALETKLNENLSPEEVKKIQVQIDTIDKLERAMKGKYWYGEENYGKTEASSKGVTNTTRRIDSEYADELINAGIDKYMRQTHKESYSEARNDINKNYDANLQKYLNNEGDSYDAIDYNKIMILIQSLKKQRAEAKLEGNTELEAKLTDQLHRLETTKRLRHNASGQFNEAAKMWITTAEGAVDTANGIMDKALDQMEKGSKKDRSQAQFIREVSDDIMDYVDNELSSSDLWNELKKAERRTQIESQIQEKIKEIADKKGIKVNDELSKKLATDIMDGQRSSEALARSIAAFRKYNFLGIDEDIIDQVETILEEADEKYDYDSKDHVKAEIEAYKLLANAIYPKGSSAQERFDAIRYFAMLANPKTHERNILGNAVFAEIINSTSNNLAAGMEIATDKTVRGLQRLRKKEVTGIKRSKAFINPASEADRAMLSHSYEDATSKVYRRLKGHKFYNEIGNAIEDNKAVFNPNTKLGKGANATLDANDTALSEEDFFFKHQKYATALTGWLKANGKDASIFDAEGKLEELEKEYDEAGSLDDKKMAELKELREEVNILNKARDYAIDQAKYATFNRLNENASKLAQHSREWMESSNPVSRFIGREIESLAAFKNTPANILRAIYDYSPLSLAVGRESALAKGVRAIASKDNTRAGRIGTKDHHISVGSGTVSEALDQLSKTITGTGIMALGALMYNQGILSSSKDKITGKSDEAEGKQEYSLNLFGKSFKIDGLAPAATLLFTGAEAKRLWDKYHGQEAEDIFFSEDGVFNNELLNDALNGALSVSDPIIDQSMLQGAASTIENIRNAETTGEALTAALVTPQIGYYSQVIPTLGGQIARTVDNTRRSLRTNTEGATGAIERSVRQAMNKIPGLNKKNAPYVDMWGRQQKNFNGNTFENAIYQALSPAYIQDINVEPYQAELDRLYEETKDSKVLNSSLSFKVDGERLSNDDYVTAQTKAGETLQSFINGTLESEAYKGLDAEVQAEVQKKLKTLAHEIGALEVRPEHKINNDLYNVYNGNNVNDVVDAAIESAETTVTNKKLKEMGLPSNNVTKSLYNANDREKLKKYGEAMQIARGIGKDSISEKQWQTYDVKGKAAFEKEIKFAKQAEDAGVTDTEAFRQAVGNGTNTAAIDAYAAKYNAITSTPTGKDDLGNETYLQYNDTTNKIYTDLNQKGLDEWVSLQKKLPNGSDSTDAQWMGALDKSLMSDNDKAYFFVLHKGKSVAKSAPKGNNLDTYAWYLAKNHFDANHNGYLDKTEKGNLADGVAKYLDGLGYKTQAKNASKWKWE